MAKLQELRKALKANFYERDEVVDGMLTALLAEENVFLLGKPGTAKSGLCSALCKSLQGNYFSWLVGKFTKPEELFGPYSLKSLEEGKYIRNVQGKMPEADVAFLDEIFKGSSAILNSLLSILNERTFFNDGQQDVPLKIAFGASNEIPESEELAALYDRFAVRFVVERIHQDGNAEDLLKRAAGSAQSQEVPQVDQGELETARRQAKEVAMNDDMINVMIKLRREIEGEGFYVSDRKWVQCISIVKAHAHLNERTQVEEDDFDVLGHVLWTNPDDIKSIRKVIRRTANPLGEQIGRLSDAVYQVMENLQAGSVDGVEGHAKIKKAQEHLQALGQKHPNNTKINDALKDVNTALHRVVKEYLGLELN